MRIKELLIGITASVIAISSYVEIAITEAVIPIKSCFILIRSSLEKN